MGLMKTVNSMSKALAVTSWRKHSGVLLASEKPWNKLPKNAKYIKNIVEQSNAVAPCFAKCFTGMTIAASRSESINAVLRRLGINKKVSLDCAIEVWCSCCISTSTFTR